jgi:hypothetical protein
VIWDISTRLTDHHVEAFKLHTTIEPKSTFKDDITLLSSTLPTPKTPASFAYRLDSKEGGRYEWMMVTYVPDDAPVSDNLCVWSGIHLIESRSERRCFKRLLEQDC